MTSDSDNAANPPDDLSQYLQTFLDETEEQLDDLVETMLALEHDTTQPEDLNEAFRLIHDPLLCKDKPLPFTLSISRKTVPW